MKPLLVATHLIAVGLGFLVFKVPGNPEEKPRPVRLSTRSQVRELPDDANPILVAGADDYRRAAELYFAEGEQRGTFESLFRDWVEIDPEGAILAFAKHYDHESGDDFLRNAQTRTGSLLAPALAKHYGEIEFVKPGTVRSVLGRSLGELANEDLDSALALLKSLPIPPRELPYREIIYEMDGPHLIALFEQLPALSKTLPLTEEEKFWENAIGRAWRILPPEEFTPLFQQLNHPEALKYLTWKSLQEATRFDEYDAFIDTFESLPPAKKTTAFAAFQELLKSRPDYNTRPFREAADRNDSTQIRDLLDSVGAE